MSSERHLREARELLSYPYCARCGLVCLKNEATRRAMLAQCVWYED